MSVDDAQRRDMIAAFVRSAQAYASTARANISADGHIWDDALDDCEKAIADLDDATTALTRVAEYLQGDLSEQAERWLEEPQRCTLYVAVQCAGVGGTVRRYYGGPTDLSTQSLDYVVVRINRDTARLRAKGTLDEHREKFSNWADSMGYYYWAVIDA